MNLTIQDIPNSILMHIISYSSEYKTIALVNKRLYANVCLLRDHMICLNLHRDLNNNLRLRESIMNTSRKIKKMNIDWVGQYNRKQLKLYLKYISAIIRKFSDTISQLKIRKLEISSLSFKKILSLCSNVKYLYLNRIECPEDEIMSLPNRITQDLNLHHLRLLNIKYCSSELLTFFNRLPEKVLVEVSLNHCALNELTYLFQKQTNIKNLSIFTCECCDHQPIKADFFHQKLESLHWDSFSYTNIGIEAILSSQTNIKVLNLITGSIGENLINVITDKLTALEKMSMPVLNTPPNSLRKISKLINLKELDLDCFGMDDVTEHFRTFAQFGNCSITELVICFYQPISDEIIDEVEKSLPNLKTLIIHRYCSNTNEWKVNTKIIETNETSVVVYTNVEF